MVDMYQVDALRLDTAAFVPNSYLDEWRLAIGVPIIAEVTTFNMSFLADFQLPPAAGPELPATGAVGEEAGALLHFPLAYAIAQAFCGWEPFDHVTPPNSAELDMRWLREVIEQARAVGLRRPDLLGLFADNHDSDRLETICASDGVRIRNALAFTLLWQGVPIVYAGTEQRIAGTSFHDDWRTAQWGVASGGFDTAAPHYRLIAALNRVRQQHRLGEQAAMVHNATSDTLVFSRGGGLDAVWVFVHNGREAGTPVSYCLEMPLPPAPQGSMWVDELSGVPARFRGPCYEATDSEPKVLTLHLVAT